MNIGFVSTWCERGAAHVTKRYLATLSASVNCFVYARGGEHYDKSEAWSRDYVTYGAKLRNGRAMSISKPDFLKWLDKNSIELVVFNEQHNWLPVIWCKDLNIKAVAYVDYYTQETLPFFGLYDGVICNTLRHCEAMNEHPNVIYVPWGTDLDLYKPSSEKWGREDNQGLRFFHSCGVSPERKGTAVLLRAFDLFKSGGGSGRLIIHSQIPLESKLSLSVIESIRRLEVAGAIEVIIGSVEAPGLYYKGDVYVYPTLLEGIGLTVAEALSSGLPVITTNEAPMNEFVGGDNGFLVDVVRRVARSDGYYWPQSFVSVESLVLGFSFYAEKKCEIRALSRRAREYAELNLDWYKNSRGLFDRISKLTWSRVDDELRHRILQFEKRKHPLPFCFDRLLSAISWLMKSD